MIHNYVICIRVGRRVHNVLHLICGEKLNVYCLTPFVEGELSNLEPIFVFLRRHVQADEL